MIGARVRRWAAPVVLFGLFFAAYRFGLVLRLMDRVLRTKLYAEQLRWQGDSGFLVSDRVQTNLVDGIFSHELSLGRDGVYTSQFGFGGWLLSLVGTVFGGGELGDAAMYTVVAGVNAALAVAAVLMVRRALSTGAAVLVAIALLQPFPTFMALSTYWVIGFKLLPALVLAIVLSRRTLGAVWLGVVVAIATVPAFLSGYEYVTMIVALPLAVMAYFGVRDGLPVRALVLRAVAIVGGAIVALAAALALHLLQLSIKFGSVSEGVSALIEIVVKRTGAGDTTVPEVYAESLASSPLVVLNRYLSMPVFGAPDYLYLPDRGFIGLPALGSVGVLLAVVATVVITRPALATVVDEKRQIRWNALGVAWLVALLGALGWFLLARPHSYIHTFINPVLWYLPAIPLGLALLWGPLVDGIRALRTRPALALAVGTVLVATLVFFGYSYLSQR